MHEVTPGGVDLHPASERMSASDWERFWLWLLENVREYEISPSIELEPGTGVEEYISDLFDDWKQEQADQALEAKAERMRCANCGTPCAEDYNFILNHTAGFYGHETEPTVVREGVFCSLKCLLSWLLKKVPETEKEAKKVE